MNFPHAVAADPILNVSVMPHVCPARAGNVKSEPHSVFSVCNRGIAFVLPRESQNAVKWLQIDLKAEDQHGGTFENAWQSACKN